MEINGRRGWDSRGHRCQPHPPAVGHLASRRRDAKGIFCLKIMSQVLITASASVRAKAHPGFCCPVSVIVTLGYSCLWFCVFAQPFKIGSHWQGPRFSAIMTCNVCTWVLTHPMAFVHRDLLKMENQI